MGSLAYVAIKRPHMDAVLHRFSFSLGTRYQDSLLGLESSWHPRLLPFGTS